MLIRLRTTLLVTTSSVILAIAAGCGGAPTSPSPAGPSWGNPGSGAMIVGVVLTGGGGSTPSGLRVSVAGTSRSTTVDGDGAFQIGDVPSGDVRLQFRDSGVDATASLGDVSNDQFIEIRVLVAATSAEILEDVRSGKVTLCHRSEDGKYQRIDVSVNAEPAHRDHGDGAPGESVPGDATKKFDARCRVVGPSVVIEKSTNGEDADEAPGPSITVGSPVAWQYKVTNNGNVQLTGIVVSDDQGVTVSCGGQTTLAPGASMTCTGTGLVTELGPYRNVGTVTANWSNGSASGSVTDDDPSHYLGISPLDIQKLTNGEDADNAPGPSIAIGDPVTWEYIVKNIGTLPLTGILVTDDRGVAVNCAGSTMLAPGATMTCTGSGVAVAGQYRNVGTATATWTVGAATGTVSDSDPSHYYGRTPDEEEGPKVSLCHRTGAGFYVLINVSINAEPAHLAHGDGKPGGAVPGQPGRFFTAGCGVQ